MQLGSSTEANDMWNAPDGFFQTLLLLAMVGMAALFLAACWGVYFLASNVSIVWGA